jgi:hypothetical protein
MVRKILALRDELAAHKTDGRLSPASGPRRFILSFTGAGHVTCRPSRPALKNCFLLSAMLLFASQGPEDLRIGTDELAMPQSFLEGPDRNIYVYDLGNVCIKVFSPNGRWIRNIGRPGQGPGEIQRAEGVRFGFVGDRLFLTEYFGGHPWISFFSLHGELVSTLRIDIPRQFGVTEAVPLPNGEFLLGIDFPGDIEKRRDFYLYKTPHTIARLGRDGHLVNVVLEEDRFNRISLSPSGADVELPFLPWRSWTLLRGRIIYCDGLSVDWPIYDLSGKKTGSLATELPAPEKVTKSDLSKWRLEFREMMSQKASTWSWYQRFGGVTDKYTKSIYPNKPIIRSIRRTPEGNILVSGLWDETNRDSRYWLLSENGKILAQIKSPIRRLSIGPTLILYSLEDENEIEHVSIRRLESESTDFRSLPSGR